MENPNPKNEAKQSTPHMVYNKDVFKLCKDVDSYLSLNLEFIENVKIFKTKKIDEIMNALKITIKSRKFND